MKIKFTPLSEEAKLFAPAPIPAVKMLPEWYKKTPPYHGGHNTTRIIKDTSDVNSTMKGCVPFLDAMTTGYMVVLAADIEVTVENGFPAMRWRPETILLDGTKRNAYPHLPREGMEFDAIKWIFDWKIETPSGYSCMYTHPINRMDLPFRTITGVVDTDSYPDAVHFPAQLLKVTEPFIIEKGTPICQIFPFKRDVWDSEIGEYDPDMKKKATFDVLSKIVKSYKNQYWHRKEYK